MWCLLLLSLLTVVQAQSITDPLGWLLSQAAAAATELAAQASASQTPSVSQTVSSSQTASSSIPTTTSATLATSPMSTPSTLSTTTAVSAAAMASTSSTASVASTASPQTSQNGLSATAEDAIIIVCTVVGTFLILAAIIGAWLCLQRRRRKQQRAELGAEHSGAELAMATKGLQDDHEGDQGYFSQAPVAGPYMALDSGMHAGSEKRASVSHSQLADELESPNLADHPAFKSHEAGASRAPAVGSVNRPPKPNGERRFSDYMPARKPVGTPPSTTGTSRPRGMSATGSAMTDTGSRAGFADARHNYDEGYAMPGPSWDRPSDGLGTRPAFMTEQNFTSPLASHPTVPPPAAATQYWSAGRDYADEDLQRAQNPPNQGASTLTSARRPQTPLGFDFGLQPSSTARRASQGELNPLAPEQYDSQEESLQKEQFMPSATYEQHDGDRGQMDPRPALEGAAENTPFLVPLSRYNQSPRQSATNLPSAPLQRSSEREPGHLSKDAQFDLPNPIVPRIPSRSPRRLSRASLDAKITPSNSVGDVSLSSHPYAKRNSFGRSRESIDRPAVSGPIDISNPQRSSTAWSHSPALGPALGYRDERAGGLVNAASHNRDHDGSPRGQHQPAHGLAGVEPQSPRRPPASHQSSRDPDPVEVSSVDSWASARDVVTPTPPPWEDNAIRRNSSTGHLGRPKVRQENSGSSNESALSGGKRDTIVLGGPAGRSPGRSQKEKNVRFSDEHLPTVGASSRREAVDDDDDDDDDDNHASQTAYGGPGSVSNDNHNDTRWSSAEEAEGPVFDEGDYQRKRDSRRRRMRSSSGGSTGFDPRYDRWTDRTFEENFGLVGPEFGDVR